MSYEVTLKTRPEPGEAGEAVERVEGADAYVLEGPLTTFFEGRDGRSVLDAWARRLASFRTADIVCIRWVPEAGAPEARVPGGWALPRRPDGLRCAV